MAKPKILNGTFGVPKTIANIELSVVPAQCGGQTRLYICKALRL